MDEHIGEELRSEDAAEQIGMSRSYFSTRFKEMTGETFHQYVIHRKMKAAAERIEEGGKSITQIATELGYDNFHYFARVFARSMGVTLPNIEKREKMSDFHRTFFCDKKHLVNQKQYHLAGYGCRR